MYEITDKSSADTRRAYDTDEGVEHYSWDGLFKREEPVFSLIPENSKLLDIGCGAGRTTRYFHAQGHDVIGIDYAPNMIEKAKAIAPQIDYRVGDVMNLEFDDHSFEVVVFSFNGLDMLHPYENRLYALREIRRVVKPEGLFIFSSLNKFLPKGLNQIIRYLQVISKRRENAYMECNYPWGTITRFQTFPPGQVRELRQVGFEVIRVMPHPRHKWVKWPWLIGLLDDWTHYVCKIQ
ncbi:hypothetical protein CEE37_14190 [candidate division LCP-89 bacterium B3_LCP]|uniref:Methyltransferase type 11 domain-containing protein n=1 Tax=candidate division LCP-89 bacterium B3_LCP TaxID=2012998 RepID=A0A532UQQ0_UNCL8|nr:MAG: hypothetical protein CEE37_14190 [candidate division LCP-89 bacterium B3_LCP]